MSIKPVIQFRAHPVTRRLLVRLREEKAVNVSAWLRQVVQRALEKEFPDFADYIADHEAPQKPRLQKTPVETAQVREPDPRKTPIEGWRPRRLHDRQWGAVLESPRVAELPDNDQLPATQITVTDRRGESWDTTIIEVVDRTDTTAVVRTSGRSRD